MGSEPLSSESMEAGGRIHVPEMEEILGRPIPVLDDGFVRVVDYMGADASVVQAARVSYGRGTKKVREDRGLVRYLMRHRHTTPFEMCEIKLHVRVPMDCWRQWVRHRTASINELSTRYSEAIDSLQKTAPGGWRSRSSDNRQGSGEPLDPATGSDLSAAEREFHARARDLYQRRLAAGVAREQARKDLPLSTYTEAYWKIDLHNLLHFLELRMEDHAQQEIRSYARTIGEQIVRRWCPLTWEAFLDYRVNALTLSAPECAVIRAAASAIRGFGGTSPSCRTASRFCLAEASGFCMAPAAGGPSDRAAEAAREAGFLRAEADGWKRSRECLELEEKMRRLGLDVPWRAGPPSLKSES